MGAPGRQGRPAALGADELAARLAVSRLAGHNRGMASAALLERRTAQEERRGGWRRCSCWRAPGAGGRRTAQACPSRRLALPAQGYPVARGRSPRRQARPSRAAPVEHRQAALPIPVAALSAALPTSGRAARATVTPAAQCLAQGVQVLRPLGQDQDFGARCECSCHLVGNLGCAYGVRGDDLEHLLDRRIVGRPNPGRQESRDYLQGLRRP